MTRLSSPATKAPRLSATYSQAIKAPVAPAVGQIRWTRAPWAGVEGIGPGHGFSKPESEVAQTAAIRSDIGTE